MDLPTNVHVHFSVGPRHEIALFRSDTPLEQIKDLFRSAAEAGPKDILKLYDADGNLVNINSSLPSNTPGNRYTLRVIAADGLAMLEDTTGSLLRALEDRVYAIERSLKHDLVHPDVKELERRVNLLREKLETSESLTWLGFNKQIPEPITSEECVRLKFRRKSDAIKQKVKKNFSNIWDAEVSTSIKRWLCEPTFDANPWEDEELLLLLQTMFRELQLFSKFAINIHVFRNFLFEAYKNYNDVPFHNFRHCFCVTQMMYSIWRKLDRPTLISDLELLILLVSCICHDLDHPGYNNIYQINAKTELAIRYNDISPLENHHCSVAFRILENEDCNIFKSFSSEQYRQIREGIIRCILATDMARHNEILTNFKEIISVFDPNNRSHTNSLCMVLIKVSDISNEARPMSVAEPWLDKLLMEFFKQSDAEKLEGLPVTPFMDREKITKPSSQCSFIGLVLLPLFEALGELFPELVEHIVQPVRDALDYYRKLNEATKPHRKSIAMDLAESSGSPCVQSPEGVPKSTSNTSVKMRKSLSFHNRSRSRSTDDDTEGTVDGNDGQNLEDVEEDSESGDDSETATEVEVSERALKFKISTEGNSSSTTGRKSYPGSRKGSRERGQNFNTSDLTRMVQRGKLRAGALSFDQHSLSSGNKKLSFDPPEFLDEYAIILKKKFEEGLANNRWENDDEDAEEIESDRVKRLSKETLDLNRKNSLNSIENSGNNTQKPNNVQVINENRYAEKDKIFSINDLSDEKKSLQTVNESKHRSIFTKFRQFTDRFGFSVDRGKLTSTPTRKKPETLEETNERRASTLPKIRKSGLHRKGWRFLGLGRERECWTSDVAVDKLQEAAIASTSLSSPKQASDGSPAETGPFVVATSDKDPGFI